MVAEPPPSLVSFIPEYADAVEEYDDADEYDDAEPEVLARAPRSLRTSSTMRSRHFRILR